MANIVILPMRKYLKQYLSCLIDIDPLVVNSKNIWGAALLNIRTHRTWQNIPHNTDKFDDRNGMKVQFSEELPPVELNAYAHEAFDLMLYRHFWDAYHQHMDLSMMFSVKKKNAALNFIDRFELDDFVELDTLLKSYQRYCNTKRKPLKQFCLN